MREFVKMMRQYASPYKGYLAGAVGLNILSAVFNIFSFAVLIPLLNILFKVDSAVYEFMPWGTAGASFKDILINNFYFYVSDFAGKHGTLNTLYLLGGIMILFTALKTTCYFGSNAVMIPIRTGIVTLSTRLDSSMRIAHGPINGSPTTSTSQAATTTTSPTSP